MRLRGILVVPGLALVLRAVRGKTEARSQSNLPNPTGNPFPFLEPAVKVWLQVTGSFFETLANSGVVKVGPLWLCWRRDSHTG